MLSSAQYLAAGSDAGPVMDVAREFSPRIAMNPGGDVVMDLAGLGRLLGDRHTIAAEVRRTAADRGLRVRVAMTDGRTAARLLVHQRPGLTVLDPAGDADALAPLPVEALHALVAGAVVDEELAALTRTLRRWGVTTLGAFVALPPDDVAARLGQRGVRWQRVAGGEDLGPLVPAVPAERFEQAMDLEWPIEGLEPLSFVLSRLLEPMSAHLERRDRGAAVLHIRLHLVSREVHERSLQLPVPMRDARTLRTLLLLDLESHPPSAAIDRVVVAVDPTPARVVQFSLLTKPLPSPEQLSTLMARLQALMGDTRCGAPAAVDSWQPGACAMQPFAPRDSGLETPARPSICSEAPRPRMPRALAGPCAPSLPQPGHCPCRSRGGPPRACDDRAARGWGRPRRAVRRTMADIGRMVDGARGHHTRARRPVRCRRRHCRAAFRAEAACGGVAARGWKRQLGS